MNVNIRLKQFFLFASDILLLYASLALTLKIRYSADYFPTAWGNHLGPFSLIFIVWLFVFYLSDLYNSRTLKNNFTILRSLVPAVITSAIISVIIFYLLNPVFQLTPKTNLLIFGLVFGVLDLGWRLFVMKILMRQSWRTRVMVIGNTSETVETAIQYLQDNPQLGYDIISWLKGKLDGEGLEKDIKDNEIDLIVIPPHITKGNTNTKKIIYELLPLKVGIIDFISFYENVFRKVPIEELEEGWFVEKIATRRRLYDLAKRALDIIISLFTSIILSPIIIIVAILTKLSPRKGPVIYKQKRMGVNDQPFTLYKFGTMASDDGALWTTENDNRITKLGKFLRYTHLDEAPQLWNILKGDISFIGPRAERVELAEKYSQLPYYEMRHIIKPGLTGWAQLNYPPSASLEEAYEKLKYDIYYIKNRSFLLDIVIIIKTIKYIFRSHN